LYFSHAKQWHKIQKVSSINFEDWNEKANDHVQFVQ
jgi:hypothetical protein